MNKTSYLLPHSFQRIGWGLLIACPVLLVLNLWIFNGLKLIPQSYSQFGILVLYITAALSALFVGLSEEKQEDEFIQTLRLRSIANTAWICFILMIISALVVYIQNLRDDCPLALLQVVRKYNLRFLCLYRHFPFQTL